MVVAVDEVAGDVTAALLRDLRLACRLKLVEVAAGKAVDIAADDTGLSSIAQFATKEQYAFADTVYQLILGGFLRATSVGFKPLKHVYNEQRGGVDFLEQELLEYSIIPIPANPEALIEEGYADLLMPGERPSWRGEEPAIVLIDDAAEKFILQLPDEPRFRFDPATFAQAWEQVTREIARETYNKLRGRVDQSHDARRVDRLPPHGPAARLRGPHVHRQRRGTGRDLGRHARGRPTTRGRR